MIHLAIGVGKQICIGFQNCSNIQIYPISLKEHHELSDFGIETVELRAGFLS